MISSNSIRRIQFYFQQYVRIGHTVYYILEHSQYNYINQYLQDRYLCMTLLTIMYII